MMTNEETLLKLNQICSGTLMEHLNIKFTEMGENDLVAEMQISPKLWQPMKILHGGASLALAESAGGALSALHANLETHEIKGMEVNANHVRSVKQGKVFAKARFIHKGKMTHVVEVKIVDEQNNLVSICRITNVIIEKQE